MDRCLRIYIFKCIDSSVSYTGSEGISFRRIFPKHCLYCSFLYQSSSILFSSTLITSSKELPEYSGVQLDEKLNQLTPREAHTSLGQEKETVSTASSPTLLRF